MECFVIFVMAWCWFNATESKPQNVMPHCRNRRYKNRKYNDNRGKHKKIKKIKQTD